MNDQENKFGYRRKDTIQVLCGLPVVVTAAIFCANFVTSYAGI